MNGHSIGRARNMEAENKWHAPHFRRFRCPARDRMGSMHGVRTQLLNSLLVSSSTELLTWMISRVLDSKWQLRCHGTDAEWPSSYHSVSAAADCWSRQGLPLSDPQRCVWVCCRPQLMTWSGIECGNSSSVDFSETSCLQPPVWLCINALVAVPAVQFYYAFSIRHCPVVVFVHPFFQSHIVTMISHEWL